MNTYTEQWDHSILVWVDSMTDSLTHRPTNQQTGQLTSQTIDWPTDRPVNRSTGWPIDRLANQPTSRLADPLANWLTDWQILTCPTECMTKHNKNDITDHSVWTVQCHCPSLSFSPPFPLAPPLIEHHAVVLCPLSAPPFDPMVSFWQYTVASASGVVLPGSAAKRPPLYL